jgi:HK97 gp10 family phage protein
MKFILTGKKEIDAVLKQLPQEVSNRALQQVNEKAAIPLVNAAHLLAPVGKTGNLAESIGTVKPSVKSVSIVGEVNVGPRRGGKYKGYHAHLVEYPKTNRDGSKSRPKPFMQPAFQRTKEEVLSRINSILGSNMLKRMQRLLK